MGIEKYPHLFEPIRLGKTTFRHRIFASPQDHPDLTANLQLTSEARAFYEVKAMGGFASVCVGNDGRHPSRRRGDPCDDGGTH